MKEGTMIRLLRPGRTIAFLTFALAVAVLTVWGGGMFSPGALNSETKSKTKIGGVSSHAELSGHCSSCHAPPWSRETMASRCIACHSDIGKQIDAQAPMHGKFPNADNCRTCHSEHLGPHGTLTSFAHFHHDFTAFKLTGKHALLDCQSCHVDNHFKGTSQSCFGCHAEPVIHKGKFGVACASCHTATSWKGAAAALASSSFDHDRTAFKLTGKHQTTDCKSCHKSNAFKGTSQSCVSCHAEPVVHLGKFGNACASCHTTATWKGAIGNANLANFDHDATGFKLTGKHAGVDCKSCHATGVFKGTSQACVSCHAEPPTPKVHKVAYGTKCATCHTTFSFKDATFKHTFPIDHHAKGNKQLKINNGGNICANCHNDTTKLTVYTCYNCHVHDPARMERRHAGRKIQNLEQCAKCHKTGRERGALDGPDRGEFLAWLVDRPAAADRPVEGDPLLFLEHPIPSPSRFRFDEIAPANGACRRRLE